MRNLPYWFEYIEDYVENIGSTPLCGEHKRVCDPEHKRVCASLTSNVYTLAHMHNIIYICALESLC